MAGTVNKCPLQHLIYIQYEKYSRPGCIVHWFAMLSNLLVYDMSEVVLS